MKKYVCAFLRKGCAACGIGPMVLVVLYLVLQRQCGLHTLTISEVCVGVTSVTALAFIAGGMNVIYQAERLPLMAAIGIHGSVLYVSYLGAYLLNGWLPWGAAPILIFTSIFLLGYLAVWAVIYAITKKNTARLNKILKSKQKNTENP